MLCSWARYLTLVVPLSTQVCKLVPANLGNARGNPAMDCHPIQGGVEILMLQKPEISAGLMGPLGS